MNNNRITPHTTPKQFTSLFSVFHLADRYNTHNDTFIYLLMKQVDLYALSDPQIEWHFALSHTFLNTFLFITITRNVRHRLFVKRNGVQNTHCLLYFLEGISLSYRVIKRFFSGVDVVVVIKLRSFNTFLWCRIIWAIQWGDKYRIMRTFFVIKKLCEESFCWRKYIF